MGGKSGTKSSSAQQERFERAKLKGKAIHLVENKGMMIAEAFETVGLQISPLTYPRIYKKYKKEGLDGLIDRRGGKRVEKLTTLIKKYIVSEKRIHERLTAPQIRELILEKFELNVHATSVSSILRDEGLSNRKGRPKKEIEEANEVAIDHAGAFLIKGMLIHTGFAKIIVNTIETRVQKIRKKRKSDLAWMGVLSAGRRAIGRKIEALVYMPIFQMERIWHFKTVYPRDGLGALCGTGLPYKYHTMDKFLREISLLDIDKQLSRDLARAYLEVFGLKFETREEQTFYIDCHKKVLWTKKNVPKGLHATRNKILKCLDVYFIHDCNGVPILPWSRPGDSHLVHELLPIVTELEKAVGEKIVKLAIFDREGLSLALFYEITERGKKFITILKDNQYDSEEDFLFDKSSRWESITIETVKKRKRYKIKDGTKVLINKESNKQHEVRAILAKDLSSGEMPVFITNMMKSEEPDAKRIVRAYIKRWDQENSFKQMKPGLYLDTNHGTKSVAMKENRVIKRKIEKLEQELSAKNKTIESAKAFIKNKLESIRKKKAVMRNKIQQIKAKMKSINRKLLGEDNPERKKSFLKKYEEIHLKESQTRSYYESVVNKWQLEVNKKRIYIRNKTDEIKAVKDKIARIDRKKPLFEIDTRKDHIMTNMEVVLNNADLFLKKHFAPAAYKNSDFKTIRDILYKQDGFIKETEDEILVSLKHYRQEPEHQMLAEHVVAKFNEASVLTDEGKRLRMIVL